MPTTSPSARPSARRVFDNDYIRREIISFATIGAQGALLRVNRSCLEDVARIRFEKVDQRQYPLLKRDTASGRTYCDAVRRFFLYLPIAQELSADLWPGDPYTFRDVSKLDKPDADRILEVLKSKFPNLLEIQLLNIHIMGVGGMMPLIAAPTNITGFGLHSMSMSCQGAGASTSWVMYPLTPTASTHAKARIVARHTVCFDMSTGRRPKLNDMRLRIQGYTVQNNFMIHLNPPNGSTLPVPFKAKEWMEFLLQNIHQDCSLLSLSFDRLRVSLYEAVEFMRDMQSILPLAPEIELNIQDVSSVSIADIQHLATHLGKNLAALGIIVGFGLPTKDSTAEIISDGELGELARLVHSRLPNLQRLILPVCQSPNHPSHQLSNAETEESIPVPVTEITARRKSLAVELHLKYSESHPMQMARHLTAFATPMLQTLTLRTMPQLKLRTAPIFDFSEYLHYFRELPRSRQEALISLDPVKLNISTPAELMSLKFDTCDRPIALGPQYAQELLERVRAASTFLKTSLNEIEQLATELLEAVPAMLSSEDVNMGEKEEMAKRMREYALKVEEELILGFEGLHPTCAGPGTGIMRPWEARWEALRHALGDGKPICGSGNVSLEGLYYGDEEEEVVDGVANDGEGLDLYGW